MKFLQIFLLIFIIKLCHGSLRNIVCKEDETCVTSLCCYFEEVYAITGTAFNFQSTIQPSYIRKIRFINSNILEIPPGMFTYFTNVVELNLRDVGLTTSNDYSFNGARRLVTLDLSHNHISELVNMMFYGAFGLGYIDLRHNDIRKIDELAFYGLKTLNTLDLRYNKIKVLPAKIWNTVEALYGLYLSHNIIDDLHDEIFIDNLFLTKVEIQNNSLVELDKRIFRYNKNIRVLNLSQNQLDSVEFIELMDINRIEELDLSHNPIHSINYTIIGGMRNLRKLNLADSGTTNVDWTEMGRLKNLFSLNVSSNSLGTLNLNTSSVLDNLTRLYIKSCDLTNIDHEKVKQAMANLKYVELDGNQWHCNKLNQIKNNLKNIGVDHVESGSDCSTGRAPQKLIAEKPEGDVCLDQVAIARIKVKDVIKNKLEILENTIRDEVKSIVNKKAQEIINEVVASNEFILGTIWE